MEVKNPQIHQSCFYHGGGEKPVIEVRKTEQGKKEKVFFEKNKILFVLEGGLCLNYKDYPTKNVEKGQFFFIPSGGEFCYTPTGESTLLIVRFQKGAFICDGYSVEQLFKSKPDYGSDCKSEEIGINALNAVPTIHRFLSGLNACIESGIDCRYYFNVKIKELLILMGHFYSRKDLRAFFSLILTPDTKFSEYVRQNYHKHKTVSELASSMNMTLKGFSKKFTKVFGETPLRWITKEKARQIYMELYSGDKPIIQIADEYGFMSQPHLNKFCKRELCKNPGEIRRRKKV